MKNAKITIGEGTGEWTILVDAKAFNFNQEESIKENMLKLFTHLGFTDVTYEEWY